MPADQSFTDLSAEEYELMLFRGELAEAGRPATVEFVVPLIDRRLQEIRAEREGHGLAPSDPAAYADAVRESQEQLDDVAAHFNNAPDHT
jgi:hypothetical protein